MDKKFEKLARFHGFWNNKIKPPYIAAMGKLKNYVQDKIDMSPIIKCYHVELETHYQKISYINTGLGKTMNNSTAFRQYYKDKYEGWNQIYTDASKKDQKDQWA
ncbi:hypothetical protein HHI36_011817 [Cryptolaemus montrouzieri]|uniref:Uncharacterized protein n=1 Tax=Cryptolaemus montrouzieri TaxID=559131 RepID=A0ABD2NCG0_9CUCU